VSSDLSALSAAKLGDLCWSSENGPEIETAFGLIVTNAVDVLISSIRIFRNKEFLIHWIQALYVPDRQGFAVV
jgi:hypothetical protein